MPDIIRIHLDVQGLVQGVGFRPFVKRLAGKYGLAGWVRNNSLGAAMELEGERQQIDAMIAELMRHPPELAQIDLCTRQDGLPPAYEKDFAILHSLAQGQKDAQVTPDAATCPDCLRELMHPADRRYRYPFINCTNCGPRFTILRDIPYDRCNTSMANFPMCPDCAKEYADAADRRFHAQPDCCPVCGPRLVYLDENGLPQDGDPIILAQRALKNGGIVAVKGLGGYHLACRIDGETIARLRKRKQRDEKPFALMAKNMAAVRKICRANEAEERALNSSSAPIVLLDKLPGAPEWVSENGQIGLMLPYTPMHHLLMQEFDLLVMTSANLSDQPALIDDAQAIRYLSGIADGFLTHNRKIEVRCDDSLIRMHRGETYPIRRSRGYAPQGVALGCHVGGVIACGAEQKASFALGKGERAYLSQHIGDLKNIETLQHYIQQIEHFRRIFGVKITRAACDLHPDYLSSDYARREFADRGIELVQVQHHHAHMLSCMADNRMYERCIGLSWDGTGLGTDGSVWGAECLAGDASGFERLGSIRPIALPGGDKCTHEIYRTAASLLMDAGLQAPEKLALNPLEYALMGRLSMPQASSMGRLFDGVFAIITGRRTVSYEGQGAVLLEAMADGSKRSYPCESTADGNIMRLDTRPIIRAVMDDLRSGISAGEIASAFMNTLILHAGKQCAYAREKTGLNTVMLSGGTFQNIYLLGGIEDVLAAAGFKVCRHRRVPANDAGIALGQLIAAAKLNLEG